MAVSAGILKPWYHILTIWMIFEENVKDQHRFHATSLQVAFNLFTQFLPSSNNRLFVFIYNRTNGFQLEM